MEDGLGNWQWLVQVPNAGDAMVLTATQDSPDWVIAGGFARVSRRNIDDAWSTAGAGAFDCVAVPDADVLFAPGGSAESRLAEVRRLLRPDGCYIGIEAIHPSEASRSLRAVLRARRRSQAPRLRRLGFRDVHSYFVVQSPAAPRHIVPSTPAALVAWDAAMSPGDERSWQRRLLYRLGLAALVLRNRLVIARR